MNKWKERYSRFPYLFCKEILHYNKTQIEHNEWLLYMYYGQGDKVLLAYRNSRKTTIIIVSGIIWILFMDADYLISIIRKSESGAIAVLKEIISHYLNNATLQQLYKDVYGFDFILSDFTQKKLNVPNRRRVAKEDNICVYGKGANITGNHYDLICLDDIVTEKDRYSKAERESTKEYVKELMNIKTVPNGKLICTDTVWHPDDLFSTDILPKARIYPIGSMPDNDFTESILSLLKKRLGTSLFACNYELKHIADENSLFPDMTFVKWDDKIHSIGWLDPAWGGECTTGMTFIQEQGNDLIIRGWVYQNHVSDVKDKIRQNIFMCNCIDFMYESNGVDIKREQEIRSIASIARGVHSSDNKHFRIIFNIKQNYHRLKFADDCQLEYLEQLKNYIEGEIPNEAPDTLASLLREKYTYVSDDVSIGGGKIKEDFKS